MCRTAGKIRKKTHIHFQSISDIAKHLNPTSFMHNLYQDLPPIGTKFPGKSLGDENNETNAGHTNLDLNISTIPSFGSKLGLLLPNPAPEVAPHPEQTLSTSSTTGPFSKYFIPVTTHHKKKTNRRNELQQQQHHNSSQRVCVFFCITDKMPDTSLEMSNPNEPRKKKYAKEAWPGRKPLLSGL